MKTTQDLFTEAVTGVVLQGEPSWDGQNCFYRDDSGHKCALGFLIEDEDYSPDMEGETISTHGHYKEINLAIQHHIGRELGYREIIILQKVQQAHDNAATQCDGDHRAFIWDFLKRCAYIADIHGLQMPLVKETKA